MASDLLLTLNSPLFFRRLRRGFWIVLSVFFGGTAALIGHEHWERYETAVSHLEEKAALVARVLDDSVSHAFHHADDALRATTAQPRPPGDLGAALAGQLKTSPHLGALALYDAAGRVVAAAGDVPSAADASEQAFFRAHRDRPDEGLRVERDGNGARLLLSRRTAERTGAFAGVAVAVFTLEPIFAFRRDAGRKENVAFALLSPDGALIAHDPPVRGGDARLAAVGGRAQGTGRGPWPFDGQDRVYAHRTLAAAPVVVAVSLSTAKMLAEIREEIAFEGVVFGAFFVFLLGGGLFLLRAVRRLGETQALHGALD
ncbi:MAG: hypothetical protein AAB543_01965, partial [Pseudomonadota bacterium]